MAVILNIDTTHETGSVSVGKDGKLLHELTHTEMRDHAGWLQNAIGSVLELAGVAFSDIDAIAVTGGPGSYTGIRVGLASAKGLAYALKRPMIQINTLKLMANTVRLRYTDHIRGDNVLLCPMIDARREEVWMGIYGVSGEIILTEGPQILTNFDFNKCLTKGSLLFFGSGADKYNYLFNSVESEVLSGFVYTASDMINISENYYKAEKFADLFYSEPYYLKEFYTYSKNS
jgi:tRNA threonylcarbamoyladenosine biosynthesis protein TsaB